MTPKRASQAPRTVVGYVRLSRLTDASTSVDRQRALIRQTCEARGWKLVQVVEDVDVSATKRRLDRPGLDVLRQLVTSGQANTILVWRLDRLARSVGDLATLVEEWDSAGAALVSATEPFDATTDAGRMMLQLLGVFAEFEAATIRARVTAARAALVKARRHAGGAAPYGYRIEANPDGAGKVLVIDPTEAAFIRQAADVVLGGGSLYSAMQMLNSAGAKPRRADFWSISSLRVVLTHDAVLGRMTHGGRVVRDDDGMPVQVWDPVLPLGDVERLRSMLETKPANEVRRRATRLLSGLVFCHSCGGRMRVNITGGANRVVRYACHGQADGRDCQAPVSIGADVLEPYVTELFLDAIGDLPVVEARITKREVADLAEVEEAIRTTTTELALADTDDDEDALLVRLRALKARRDEIAATPSESTVEYVETDTTFREVWANAGPTDSQDAITVRRELLASAFGAEGIVVYPGQRGRKGMDPERVHVPFAPRLFDHGETHHGYRVAGAGSPGHQ